MRQISRVLATFSAALLLTACGEQSGTDSSTQSLSGEVLTTFAPTTYLANRIAGEHVDVVNPIPADADPIFYEPSAELIARYQDATLIIINGAEFEKWALTAPLPRSRVVNTADGFADSFVKYEVATTHSHGDGEHTHEGIDGHTWLDPINAIEQARSIRDTFVETFPDHAADFNSAFESLETDLNGLHSQLEEVTSSLGAVELHASHPAYNYLAQRYGWVITNHDFDPEDAEGSIATIDETFATESEKPRLMLWESSPDPAISAHLQDRFNVKSVVFSPAETRGPEDPDYLAVMRANLDALADAAR